MVRVTQHAQQQGRERMGVDMYKFAALAAAQGLALPDGTYQTEQGTVVVQGGAVRTVLTPDMTVVHSKR